MKDYSRPMTVVVDDVAEGVYLASGTAQSTGSGEDSAKEAASYTLKQTNAWDGNKQYDINFTNNLDKKVDSVTVELKVKGKVTSIGGNVTGTINGSTAKVTFNNYGNGIEAKASTGNIYMAVTGEGDFSLE